MFNIVLVLRPSRPENVHSAVNTVPMLVDSYCPTRISFVPIVETRDSMKMARVFYYLEQNYDRLLTIPFFCLHVGQTYGYRVRLLIIRQIVDL